MARGGDSAARAREWIGLIVVASIVAVAFWPTWTMIPGFGLDQSWRLGLAWAAQLGMQWGPDIAFTFGPLGFTLEPLAISRQQVVIASIVHLGAAIGSFAVAYQVARTRDRAGTTLALVLAGASTGLALLFAPATMVFAMFGSIAFLALRSWRLVFGVGVALGLIGQQKLSEAMLVLGFAVLCVIGGRGLRGLAALGAVTGATWVGVWVATGQSVVNIPDWLRAAAEIGLGYAAAMSMEQAANLWHYVIAAGLVILTLAFAWSAGIPLGRRPRLALMAASAWALWLAWRAAFTRHDGHALIFGEVTIVLTLTVLLIAWRTASARIGLLVLVLSYASMIAFQGWFLHPVDRSSSLQTLGRIGSLLSSTEFRDQMLLQAKADISANYPAIGPDLREAIGVVPTLADPWDISEVWAATDAAWQPLPVIQTYSAYTPELDRMNAQDLLDAPRQVLRASPYVSIDGRNPIWEVPSYQLQVYCRYSLAASSPGWLALRDTRHESCGPAHVLDTVEATAGEQVRVPHRPGEMTLVTIEPQPSLWDRLLALVFKAGTIDIQYGPDRWRFAHGARATRLMLNGPVAHRAFETQPTIPLPTISLNVPATFTFETMTVAPAASPSSSPDIGDLIVRQAVGPPTDPSSPQVHVANDIDLDARESCIAVVPTGADPFVEMEVPDGSGMWMRSESGGQAQIFLGIDHIYSEGQSVHITMTDAPLEAYMPARDDGAAAAIRVDPPSAGRTELCLVRLEGR